MSENNTTVADCVADCVEASSGLLDDIEMVLVAGGALLGLAAWAYQKYKKITAGQVLQSLLSFLLKELGSMDIVFHGGEPLQIFKLRFKTLMEGGMLVCLVLWSFYVGELV